MPAPWIHAGALIIGVVMAIGYAVVKIRQQHSYARQQYRRERSPEPGRTKNVACPFCGQRLWNNVYTISCGHRAHRKCYDDRLRLHKDTERNTDMPCPICGETRNRPSASNDHSRLSDEHPVCSYCLVSLQRTVAKIVQLDCGHYIHAVCKLHYGGTKQCSNCLGETSTNMKCSCCDMPIASSRANLTQRNCGHFIHSTCQSISNLMNCTTCEGGPEGNGAP